MTSLISKFEHVLLREGRKYGAQVVTQWLKYKTTSHPAADPFAR